MLRGKLLERTGFNAILGAGGLLCHFGPHLLFNDHPRDSVAVSLDEGITDDLPNCRFFLPRACRRMIYRFGPYEIDGERRELSCNGDEIPLQPQAFSLLVYLVENTDRVVPKDEIFDTVWQGRMVGDSTLNSRINALRRALGDDGNTQAVIKTLPRQGFRFVGDISADPASATPRSEDQAPAPGEASIAVLPFVNIGADREQIYFADGLTEDLITDLGKNRDLFVIARNSSFSYRNSPKSVTEIGQELGVAHVLEGSVRKAGNRIRITAQLISTKTGGHVWAERYDSDLEDIFALQDEITGKIISAVHPNLSARPGTDRGTHSVQAYELSLKGRAKFFMFSPETNKECINLLDRALAIDPTFADAWAGQVFPYQSGWSFAWPGYDDGLLVAAQKARRAVELAPNSSLAHCRLGWVQTFLRQTELSIESFEQAIEIDPNSADTHAWFSEALNYAGQPERAVQAGLTALRFDPVATPNVIHHIGHGYFLMGDLVRAEDHVHRAIRMAPSFPPARIVMTAILAEAGRADEAREQIADLKTIDSDYTFQRYEERYPYFNPRHKDRMMTALLAAGLR